MLTSTCTQSATASVRTIGGDEADGGVSAIPSQPATPMAVRILKTITMNVPTIDGIERSRKASVTSTIRNMIGISVVWSRTLTSGKLLFMITMPVR